jgi:recombination protein RecT
MITGQELQKTSAKELFSSDAIKKKFNEILGQKAQGFMTSVLQIVGNSKALQDADPKSIYNAAAIAATLDLPINPNLGFACILPYNQSYKDGNGAWQKMQVAQFQVMVKGYKQLALRSGQFLKMNASDVREGELKSNNRLSGEVEFEWIQDDTERLKKPIIGYVSYFQLLNGFESTLYMSSAEVTAHGKKYSQSFATGQWTKDFSGMALKTVVKLNLSKNAPLSIEMQRAIVTDQSVINNAEDIDNADVTYVDNEALQIDIDEPRERLMQLIKEASTLEELESHKEFIPDGSDIYDLYQSRFIELSKKKK